MKTDEEIEYWWARCLIGGHTGEVEVIKVKKMKRAIGFMYCAYGNIGYFPLGSEYSLIERVEKPKEMNDEKT